MTLDLFGDEPALPNGFSYQAEVLSAEDERDLLAQLAGLPFKHSSFTAF